MTKLTQSSTVCQALTPDHLDALHSFFSRNVDRIDDTMVWLWANEPEIFREYFEPIAHGDSDCVTRVILCGNQVVGVIESSTTPTGTRIGYMIDQDFEGQGIMYTHLCDTITHLPHPVEASIHNSNIRSQRLVERIGFINTGCEIFTDHTLWCLS